jgi:ubiquinone/menaquinone biosynthesis C-methylase UbiE
MAFSVPAEVYDRHIGRYSRELARALIGAAGVRPGDRVLDVGCGPGGLTTELVALLGSDAVAAVEPSPTFAAACAARLPEVDVRRAGAEALPFAGGSFDRVLAQLVVNFLPDPDAGVAEMRRVARPGATLAAAVWDYSGEMTLLRAFWDAAVAVDPAAAEHDEGRAMRLGTPDELHALWTAAGLRDVAVAPVVVGAGYADLDDLWAPLTAGVGPSGAYVVALPDDAARAALKAALGRRLGVGAAPFRLTARAWIVTGTTPPASAG